MHCGVVFVRRDRPARRHTNFRLITGAGTLRLGKIRLDNLRLRDFKVESVSEPDEGDFKLV